MDMKSEASVMPSVSKHDRKGVRVVEVGTASPRRTERICSRALTSDRVTGAMMDRRKKVDRRCEEVNARRRKRDCRLTGVPEMIR
jgi:hypothetical protein